MATYTMTIEEIVENDVDIFDFDYPLYDEGFRNTFESMFIDFFYFDEIGAETLARFKHLLKTKLNLVMPYWNKIYTTFNLEQRILNNYSIEEIFEKTSSNNIIASSTSVNKNLYKDAPKTKIDIGAMDIVNSISKDEGTTSNNNLDNGTENWKRTMEGNVGVATDSDAVKNYCDNLRNTTQEIFEKDLSILFMGVY